MEMMDVEENVEPVQKAKCVRMDNVIHPLLHLHLVTPVQTHVSQQEHNVAVYVDNHVESVQDKTNVKRENVCAFPCVQVNDVVKKTDVEVFAIRVQLKKVVKRA